MRLKVNFNKAPLLGDDLCYAENAIKSGRTFGDGPITREVESFLLKQFNLASGILLTSSCTHALEIISILLNLKKDDEIIVPSYTFCSSASAFMLSGAKIVFADCEVPTMNINPLIIENLISKKTKAIVVVHYGGLGCNMERIMEITRRNKLILIEDNAHGFFGEINGKKLGSFGDFSTLSFHGTKNISCGEGGALVVNNPKFLDHARVIREKGTNRFDFKAGKINKYEWVDLGSSYLMSEISAGILKKQLEHFEKIQNTRKTIWFKYQEALLKWGNENDVILPSVPEQFIHAYHAFHLIFPSAKLSKLFMKYMKSFEIEAISHYQPLHNSPIIRKAQNPTKNIDTCPNSTIYSERLVRLPLYFGLDIKSVEYVIELVLGFKVENIKI